MTTHDDPTTAGSPAPAAPRRTRERTAWWTVFTVLNVCLVLMLGLGD